MTKAELIAALKATKAEDDEEVYVWDAGNGDRHRITKVDDGGCLDLNCNDADFDPEED